MARYDTKRLAEENARVRSPKVPGENKRFTMNIDPELYARICAVSPPVMKNQGPDICRMLEDYLDLREKYGRNIFEGIYEFLLTGEPPKPRRL